MTKPIDKRQVGGLKIIKVTILLFTALLLTGCATIYYDETWEHTAPWPLPTKIRIFVADIETVNRICEKLTLRRGATGCYDPIATTIYTTPRGGTIVHELKHVYKGYYHGLEEGSGWLGW